MTQVAGHMIEVEGQGQGREVCESDGSTVVQRGDCWNSCWMSGIYNEKMEVRTQSKVSQLLLILIHYNSVNDMKQDCFSQS